MFNIVLLEPEKPSNTGNIGRTCLLTDSRLHLIRPFKFQMDDKTLRRTGLDYWKDVRSIAVSPTALIITLKAINREAKKYSHVTFDVNAYHCDCWSNTICSKAEIRMGGNTWATRFNALFLTNVSNSGTCLIFRMRLIKRRLT